MPPTLDTIEHRFDESHVWPADAGEMYEEIVRTAAEASMALKDHLEQPAALVDADVLKRLGRIARKLGEKLKVAAEGLQCTGCCIEVSAMPPSVNVTIDWTLRAS